MAGWSGHLSPGGMLQYLIRVTKYFSSSFLQINHLADGMKVGLSDKVEKHSDKLGRDAVFTLNSKIKRLPRYLCIQVK